MARRVRVRTHRSGGGETSVAQLSPRSWPWRSAFCAFRTVCPV
ncbi:MAG: hypothetical protein BIP78_0298 [Candidatus Bipolaricaulis sibiricus]|uniref:Uncharacterized protein n=1 Tax=Bipolaricaulis sibiricus TaxID=2501609 RepID=A0A410FSV1_BIPS1|nr:MAG: hypothetical protein BIP78_0298 [Candidatus Bipolaricaulis sibiricus]